jgi:hypothetical protein
MDHTREAEKIFESTPEVRNRKAQIEMAGRCRE